LGLPVVGWPDADADGVGRKAMTAALLRAEGAGAIVRGIVAVPSGFPDRWDLADPWPVPSEAADVEVRVREMIAAAVPVAGTAKPEVQDYGRQVAPMPFVTFAEIVPKLNINSVIKRVLGSGGMSEIYGATNTGKTFIAVDMGLHVATGWEWFGHKVRQGGVIYVPVEGAFGVENRIAAFRQHYNLEGRDIPFAVVPAQIDLRSNAADADRLIATVKEVAKRFDCPLVFIIIDTLARALAGGSDSDPEDMGSYIMNIDRIRIATGAHVLSVHHSGKDPSRGSRGHSSMPAAVDTDIEVTRQGQAPSILKFCKQRDLPLETTPIVFCLKRVVLGRDEDGDEVSSCVVQPAEGQGPPTLSAHPGKPKMNAACINALDLLRRAIDEAGEVPPASNHIPPSMRAVRTNIWREYCYNGSLTKKDTTQDARLKSFNRSFDKLQSLKAIQTWDDWVWLVP
jgi:AAA domain